MDIINIANYHEKQHFLGIYFISFKNLICEFQCSSFLPWVGLLRVQRRFEKHFPRCFVSTTTTSMTWVMNEAHVWDGLKNLFFGRLWRHPSERTIKNQKQVGCYQKTPKYENDQNDVEEQSWHSLTRERTKFFTE